MPLNLAFSPDSELLAVAFGPERLMVGSSATIVKSFVVVMYTTSTLAVVGKWQFDAYGIDCLAIAPSGQYLAASICLGQATLGQAQGQALGHVIRLWSIPGGELAADLPIEPAFWGTQNESPGRLAFGSDQLLAAARRPGRNREGLGAHWPVEGRERDLHRNGLSPGAEHRELLTGSTLAGGVILPERSDHLGPRATAAPCCRLSRVD